MIKTKYLLKTFVFHLIIAIVFSLHSFALEKPTHEAINEYIGEHTIQGFSLDEYLIRSVNQQDEYC